jgi:hypothetical protein
MADCLARVLTERSHDCPPWRSGHVETIARSAQSRSLQRFEPPTTATPPEARAIRSQRCRPQMLTAFDATLRDELVKAVAGRMLYALKPKRPSANQDLFRRREAICESAGRSIV